MDLTQYIINDIDPVDVSLPVGEVKRLFEQLTYSHIPTVRAGVYAGCVSEPDARCFDADKPLSDYSYALEDLRVRVDTNWLDVLEAFAVHTANIMPVFDKNGRYVGYFELADIMNQFNHTPFLNENGDIIVVEKDYRDSSISELAQVAESDNAKILGIFVSKLSDETAQTTLKLKTENLNTVLQSFRRYGYTVITSHRDDKMLESLKKRSEYLSRYLDM